jgi:enoyl-CoA hydratase/carnithine racemase
MKKYDFLKFEVNDHVAKLTLNRPESMNALNPPLWNSIIEAMKEVRDNKSIWVAVITGAGDRAFCAGADLKWRSENEEIVKSYIKNEDDIFFNHPKFELWKPVIAAVNGYAVGGGLELALACDLIVASENAKLGLPEPKRGLMADGGGIQGFIRQIPYKQAMEIILSGEFIDAKKGYEIGIVNRLSRKEDLMKEVDALTDSILKCSPMAIQAAKQSAVLGKDMNYDDAQIAEFSMFKKLKKSNDFVEGPRAFSEKRNPKWKSE